MVKLWWGSDNLIPKLPATFFLGLYLFNCKLYAIMQIARRA
jgi:hypothetical protein